LPSLGRLRREFQAPKPRIPESINESPQLLKPFGPNRIEAFRSYTPLLQKASAMQDAQMLRYRRAAGIKVQSYVAGRQLAATDETKYLETSRVCQRLNGCEDRHLQIFVSCALRKRNLTQ